MTKKLTIALKIKPSAFAKALLTMKLIFLLIIAGGMQASANVHAQNKVSLKLQEVQVTQVLNIIENQTNFRFLYNNQLKSLQEKVSIEVTNEDIASVLKTLFSGKDLSYKVLENNLIVILAGSPTAQDIRVTGKITSDSGDPLSGVSITVKGTSHGTSTNNIGEFDITAPENGTLVASYVGYETQELPVNGQSTINIKLHPSNKALDQVIVVGYGTQKKIEVTSAISHINASEIIKQPVYNPVQALQGLATGVQISSSGQPGSQPQVIIRGAGSILGGVNPLYVVDGIPIIDGDISSVNSADIISVDVLKDAASCAIYGARAANGVILISTRQGSGKMKINYTGTVGFSLPAYVIPMANAQQYQNYYGQAGYPLTQTSYNTDWFKQIFRTAIQQNHYVSIAGSSEQDRYFFGFGYLNQDGIILNNNYQRFTIRLNNEYTPTKYIKLGIDVSLETAISQNVPGGGGAITLAAYEASPIIPVSVNGKWGDVSAYQNTNNPVLASSLNQVNDVTHDYSTLGNAYIEIRPFKEITIKSSFGGNVKPSDERAYTYEHPDDSSFFVKFGNHYGEQGAYPYSYLSTNNITQYNWEWDNTLNYSHTFGDNHLGLLLGTTAEKYQNNEQSLAIKGVPADPNLWYVQNGIPSSLQYNQPASGYPQKWTRAGYIARVNYTYADKYQLTANFRADGSSVFTGSNTWGYFPGVSAGWVISRESFMDRQKAFQYLKLRGGWGELGNSNIPTDASYYVTYSGSGSLYYFNSQPVVGSIIPRFPVQGLKWEVTKESDIGLDFTTLNNKLTGEMDVYNKRVNNALINAYAPGTFGVQNNPNSSIAAGYVIYNAAVIDNKGAEIMLRWHDNISKKWSYSISVNMSYNKNDVVSLASGTPYTDGYINGAFTTETVPGSPIGSFYVRKVTGVAQIPSASAGQLTYLTTKNGTDSLVNAGAYLPKLYGGINASINYGNFDFSINIYANIGNKVYNGLLNTQTQPYYNLPQALATNYWTPTNKSNSQPMPGGLIDLPPSTYFVSSGTFYRINNLTIGYNVPASVLAQKVSSLRIYVSAQNPVTKKYYAGFSSEIPGSATAAGIDNNSYPTIRTFIFGVNLGL
jgi:TonB-linked SusC/RagA family outer membrane protein